MKRRYFIKGAGYLGLLAFLQACRITDLFNDASPVSRVSTSIPTGLPTFTPTATSSPLPTPADNTATPTATGASTPHPTATQTLEPTPDGTALPSPTPTPTPYPPGPPSKLGLFVTRFHPEVLDLVEHGKPALVKTLEIDPNFVKGLKDSSPTTLIAARLVLGEQMNLDVDPIPLAREFVDKLLPLAAETRRMEAITAWEAYNEPVADTPDKMKRLADFEAERTRLLAEHTIRSVVGNFGTGHPPLELWADFKPALDAVQQYNGYLGLHEYSAPVMQYLSGNLQPPGDPHQGDEGWLTLRYRKAYRRYLEPMGFANLPILITECGVDGLVQPRPGPPDAQGWQDFIATWLENGLRDDPPGVYMDQLIWYDENLQRDDYIKGSAIFLAGTNDARWESYDILGAGSGRMVDLLRQYLQVHPPIQ